jgi:GNAT superfamily N-acetyltransferase
VTEREQIPDGYPPDGPAALQIRGFRGYADVPGMTEANNAMRLAAGSIELMTVEMIEAQYANLSHSDPERDVFVAELGGRIVGYARSEQADTTDGVREHMAIVFAEPGAHQRRTGASLLAACEARALDRIADDAAAGRSTDRPLFYGAFSFDRDEVYTALVLERGYQPIRRSYEMIRPTMDGIPDLVLPPGIELRPVLPEHHRAIFDADVEAFSEHWGWVDGSDAAFRRFLEDPSFQPDLWTIAWDGEQIAGQVRAYIIDEDNERLGVRRGWTENISVRKPWRGRGIAKALIAESLRIQRDRGMTESALTVDAGNETGAVQLYRTMGFEISSSQTQYRRPMMGTG